MTPGLLPIVLRDAESAALIQYGAAVADERLTDGALQGGDVGSPVLNPQVLFAVGRKILVAVYVEHVQRPWDDVATGDG